MADEITVKDDGPRSTPHEEGQFASVCVDVIDLGERVETYQGKDPKIVRKMALLFRTEAVVDGKPCHISQEFTVSMGRKSNLRKFLGSWRGKSLSDEEAMAGIPVHKMAGLGALLTIEHKESSRGSTYGKINSIAKLPKQMTAPAATGYERAEFWTKRKQEYADEVAAYRKANVPAAMATATTGGQFSDYPEAVDNEDDDLPF